MSAYKIRGHIEMLPCNDEPTSTPVKEQDGSLSLVLSETDAISIDACEQALLQTTYPTLRETLSTHLSELSKKVFERQSKGELMENTWPYRVDGEVGRIEFPTYRVVQGETVQYDTAREFFAPLGCWERYETRGFKELAFIRGVTEQSYKKTALWLNRVRHQDGATGSTTLRVGAEREGGNVLECLERTTTDILKHEGFDETGQPVDSTAFPPNEAAVIPAKQVTAALDACDLTATAREEVERNPVPYEQPSETVNVSIDDVVVKQQKAHRRTAHDTDASGKDTTKTGRKYVHNTVAHLQHQEQSYCITGQGVPAVLRIVLGYVLTNVLLGCRLQFFVDGQKTLQAAILNAFAWFSNSGMILDWYHLEDKCARQLSLAMKGAELRNEALSALSGLLWYGRVDSAKTGLQRLPAADLKKPDEIRVLVDYLERHRPYLPCYAVRKRLGLRNSSNIGEKMKRSPGVRPAKASRDELVCGRLDCPGSVRSVKKESRISALV